MVGWITELTSILGVELTLGATEYTLGGIALGMIILGSGIWFFRSLKKSR